MIELIQNNPTRVTCEELNKFLVDYLIYLMEYYDKNNPLSYEWENYTKIHYNIIKKTISSINEFDLIVKDIVKHNRFEPYHQLDLKDYHFQPIYLKGEIIYDWNSLSQENRKNGIEVLNQGIVNNVYEIIFENIYIIQIY